MEYKYLDVLERVKIVPVIKLDNIADTIPLLQALKDGGIPIAEITYRTFAAAEAIKIGAETFPDMVIGAGSVIKVSQASQAVKLGAKFIVSPGFSGEVAEFCVQNGIDYYGGAVTPTEIMLALSYGLSVIKFFPSESFGGLDTINALSAPFPTVKFMPTGGINQKNIKAYLSNPKVVACGGSWMVKDTLIKAGDFEKIKELCKQAVKEVQQ